MTMKPSITSLDPKHKEDCVQVITDATRKATDVAIDELVETGVVNNDNIQRVRAQGDKIVLAITKLVKKMIAEFAENIVGPLKLISGDKKIVLQKTDDQELLAEADDIFNDIDPDFKNYGCNVKGAKSKPTAKTAVQVYELVKDATFQQMFGAFGENLDRLCFSQSQIKKFVRNHREMLALNWWTSFLFKVEEEFFVARVSRYNSGILGVHVYYFSDKYVWNGGYGNRLVIPQP